MALLPACVGDAADDDHGTGDDASPLGCAQRDEWIECFAETYCKQLEECEDGFSDVYDDIGECVEDASADIDPDAYEHCEFDGGVAVACLNAMQDAGCDEWIEDAAEACQEGDIYAC